MGAYLTPTCASIYWLYTNGTNNNSDENYFLLAMSCLLLDFKFLLFFRAFELFGVYFVIMIGVAKKIVSFLVILFIILLSFAHAFLILLRPRSIFNADDPQTRNEDDSNNPWSLTDKYYYLNDTTKEPFAIQQPDKNTNMFTDASTALFAMYLYLTGIIFSFEPSIFNHD